MKRPLEVRFWSFVDKADCDECWNWTGGKCEGYGIFQAMGRSFRAHRFAYELLVAPIEKGMLLRHTCDNPSCVNPAHLLPGTDQDNSDDKVSRGRSLIGERHPLARLNESQVVEIRRRVAMGETQTSVGPAFGITQVMVSRIVRRVAWKHVP